MTLPEVRRLFNHWKRQPPLRTVVSAVATALGVKLPDPEPPSQKRHMTADEARMLERVTGGRVPGTARM